MGTWVVVVTEKERTPRALSKRGLVGDVVDHGRACWRVNKKMKVVERGRRTWLTGL